MNSIRIRDSQKRKKKFVKKQSIFVYEEKNNQNPICCHVDERFLWMSYRKKVSIYKTSFLQMINKKKTSI